jgi:D-serine deaminase-like pyridoxal phosphate-dependent protein
VVTDANQEHGILAAVDREPGTRASVDDVVARFPVGTKLRILPNHACATGGQFSEYHALTTSGELATWPRFSGW